MVDLKKKEAERGGRKEKKKRKKNSSQMECPVENAINTSDGTWQKLLETWLITVNTMVYRVLLDNLIIKSTIAIH